MANANCAVIEQKYGSGSYNNDASAYVGFNYSAWYPYALKFTTPSFPGKSTSLTFSLSLLRGSRNGAYSSAVSLRYALCKSDANFGSYNGTSAAVSDANQITSGTITFSGLTSSYSAKTLTISTEALSPNTTYYLILWGNNAGGYQQDYATANAAANHTVSLAYADTYSLSISQGAGTTITVMRNGVPLANGSTITYGDVLVVYISANTGYHLTGNSHNNGATITVTGNVSVWATAALNTYTLSISAGTGSSIAVSRNGVVLAHGATITYGDVLTITFAADAGYNLAAHTVNGAVFASGGQYTVTGAVAVVSTATLKTFALSISAGTGSIIRVVRNGTALGNGATLTYGDVLTITFAASEGYYLAYTSHTSGDSYTVTDAVAVSATAAVISFRLTISQGEGTTVTVSRTSSPKQGASAGALSDGATVYYSDVLEITISAKGGYKLTSGTVNGDAFTSGDTHTVTGAVNVAALAALFAYLIGNGTSQKKYVAQIKSGGEVKTYVGFIKQGGIWYPCGQ